MRLPVRRRYVLHSIVGGVAAGLVGGFVMQMMMLATAAIAGRSFPAALKLAATPFLGERALSPVVDYPAMLLGLLCHYAVAVGWGVLFALAVDGAPYVVTLLAGVVSGFVAWLAMAFVVLPAVGLVAMGHAMGHTTLAAVQHALFGLTLGAVYLGFQHRFHRVHRRADGETGAEKQQEYGWVHRGDAPMLPE